MNGACAEGMTTCVHYAEGQPSDTGPGRPALMRVHCAQQKSLGAPVKDSILKIGAKGLFIAIILRMLLMEIPIGHLYCRHKFGTLPWSIRKRVKCLL